MQNPNLRLRPEEVYQKVGRNDLGHEHSSFFLVLRLAFLYAPRGILAFASLYLCETEA